MASVIVVDGRVDLRKPQLNRVAAGKSSVVSEGAKSSSYPMTSPNCMAQISIMCHRYFFENIWAACFKASWNFVPFEEEGCSWCAFSTSRLFTCNP